MGKFFSINEVAVLNESSIKSTDSFGFINYLDTSSLTKNRIDGYQLLNDHFPSRAKRKVKKNTILYSTVRPNQEHYGIFETIDVDKNIIASTGFTTIDVFHKEVNPKYLFYKLTQKEITNYLQTIAENSVSAYPSIKPSDIGELNFKFPDIAVQQRIASVLSSLDDKIELNNRINAEIEAMAKMLYDYWFVQFDFPDANGKPYKSSGGKMLYNEELKREIPQGWEVKTLFEITSLIRRGISPKYVEDGGYLVLNQKCIRNQTISFELGRSYDNKLSINDERLIELGDVLVNSTGVGTLGRVAFVKYIQNEKATVDSHITIVRGNPDLINTEYLNYWMLKSEKDIERAAEGSTGQVELRKEFLENLLVIIPSDDIQKKFSNIVIPLNGEMASREKENQHLASLCDWLLPMLMNGQVGFKEAYKEQTQTVSIAAEVKVEYKPTAKNDNFYKIQNVYAVLYANKLINVQQGEMALAKDMYLVDRIAQVNTGFTYAQYNWGSFDPAFKKTINNTQFFAKCYFPNSKAYYCDTADNGYLLAKIPSELKEKAKATIAELHNKIFKNYFGTKKAEMKELYATVLKCIEDTQSTDFVIIRQAMKNWKTPKQSFPDKATKFSEQQTKEALIVIIKEGWDKKVLNRMEG